jgi:hypothetical protein
MARTKDQRNGKLEEAMASLVQNQATLLQNQATLVQTQTTFVARMVKIDEQKVEMDRRLDETQRLNAERFARIEAILIEHTRILHGLPEAIREKIGFKLPERSKHEGKGD